MIAVEGLQRLVHRVAVGRCAGAGESHRSGLDRHRVVHHMRGEDTRLPRHLLPVLEVREVLQPVVPLRPDTVSQLEQPLFACPVVQPVQAENKIGPAVLAPLEQRPFAQRLPQVAREARQDLDHPRVAGGLVVLGEHLQHNGRRPLVIGLVARRLNGPKPAGVILEAEECLHPLAGLGLERRVIEQVGQRDEAVGVVRATLPALFLSAEPQVVGAKVRPDLIEMSGEAVGLDAQLPQQPPERLHRPEGQGSERPRLQGRAGCDRSPVHRCLTRNGVQGTRPLTGSGAEPRGVEPFAAIG